MYEKILIPLDGSQESERVLPAVQKDMAPDGEVMLLQVIPPARTRRIGENIVPASQQEKAARLNALSYLQSVSRQGAANIGPCRGVAVIAESVIQGIVDFAQSEGVDLIAMYAPERKGTARVKGSIARDVRRSTRIQVKVFEPRELVAVA